jgi:hypothetical protein
VQETSSAIEVKPSNLRATNQDEATFSEVVRLIVASRERALQEVNTELIDLYWQVGATISRKIKATEWGDGAVEQLAAYIAKMQPGLRVFTRANLFRMRQFYETYQSYHCCDNCHGRITSSFWDRANVQRNLSSTCALRSKSDGAGASLNVNFALRSSNDQCSVRQKSHQRCDKHTLEH